MTLIKRRLFMKMSASAIVGGMVLLWAKMTGYHLKPDAARKITVPFDQNKEVSFYGDFIVINKGGDISVFSSSCTHLGCKIEKSEKEKLVCPCHGSLFDFNGNAVKGPAYKPLKKLSFVLNGEKKQIVVSVA